MNRLSLTCCSVGLAVAALQPTVAQETNHEAVRLAFDVASVRQNISTEKASSNIAMDRVVDVSPISGTLVARNEPFIAYMIFAYSIHVSEFYGGLLKSLPKWAVEDRFDVTAKTDKPDPSKEDIRAMTQTLLEERFAFKGHREKRKISAFLLELSKNARFGPGLRASEQAEACRPLANTRVPTGRASEAIGLWPATCGDGADAVLPGPQRMHRTGGRDMTMPEIASWLSGIADLDLQLIDGTDLKGKYDFILDCVPEHEGLPPAVDEHVDAGPSCRQAITDQLGLHLKKGEGQASFFIVDQVEPLTPN